MTANLANSARELNAFLDVFFVSGKPKKKKLYRVIYPCGKTFEYDIITIKNREGIPHYVKGKYTGMDYVFESLREANETLIDYGYKVEYLGLK
jgi:hypothetical protein